MKVLTLVALATALALTGCHASCKDFCADATKCLTKLIPNAKGDSFNADECTKECEKEKSAGKCAEFQKAIDCADSALSKCESLSQVSADSQKCPQCRD